MGILALLVYFWLIAFLSTHEDFHDSLYFYFTGKNIGTTGTTSDMTRAPSSTKGGAGGSYQVTSPHYRGAPSGGPYQYPNYSAPKPPHQYEMSEFTASSHYISSNGHNNGKNGRSSVNGNYNGKVVANVPVEDEEEEFDRGHWGSKAEFILSCIGFSVSKVLTLFETLISLKVQ